MKLISDSFADGAPIAAEFAFCAMDAKTHATLSSNRNPQFSWHNAPAGTKSFALMCVDPDVPSMGDDVNKEGRIVPASLPRVDFFHWALIDIPAARNDIAAGEFSSCVVAKGKTGPDLPDGMRHGINDYTNWFAGDTEMGGDYYGYDGPCPPWNDAISHRYMFTLYALDVSQLALNGRFTGADVRMALKHHVLAEATITGRYTLNPAVKL